METKLDHLLAYLVARRDVIEKIPGNIVDEWIVGSIVELAALKDRLAEAERVISPVADWAKMIYIDADGKDTKDLWLYVRQILAAAEWMKKVDK